MLRVCPVWYWQALVYRMESEYAPQPSGGLFVRTKQWLRKLQGIVAFRTVRMLKNPRSSLR
jgi:hypothetical protein